MDENANLNAEETNLNADSPEYVEDMGLEDLENRLILTDEETGVDTEFQFLDVIELDDKKYLIVLPLDKIEEGEVAIFRMEGEGQNQTYIGVETEEEAQKVFDTFKEKAKDTYNFVD